MYPFRFEPLFQRYLWGGHRLGEVLGKSIGNESAAESWEVVDHQDNQSVVKYGELAGFSLRQLIADHGNDLLGKNLMQIIASSQQPEYLRNRFPLLLKFLDANRDLSVQVHPDDQMGATLSPPDLGKTEAWYVMHADPGAKIYAGLKEGVTKEDFQHAVANGKTSETLHSLEPKQGDCVFIRAGTIHAIGAGLLVAEIQQASNTTFRVDDWGRVDKNGEPRELHISQAIQATDFSLGPVSTESPQPTDSPNWNSIVQCDKFEMRRGNWNQSFEVANDHRFRMIAITGGSLSITGDPSGQPLKLGDTALIPACLGAVECMPGPAGVELLEISIPNS